MEPRARKAVVVTRPEPPPDQDPKKLSREEVQALLAVARTNAPAWPRALKRAGLGLLPTAILGVVLDAAVGWWSTPLLVVLLLAWSAWPLLRRDRDGWT